MRNIGTRSALWRVGMDVVLLVVGIIFCANARGTFVGVDVAYGIILIVYGTITIALDEIRRAQHEHGGNFVWGCAWLIAGILLVVFAQSSSAWLFPLAAGIWMLLEGVASVRTARVFHQTGEKGASIGSFLGIAELILGILTLCGMTSASHVTPLPGVCMLLFGICAILSFMLGWSTLRPDK